jgi:hypothetical protein
MKKSSHFFSFVSWTSWHRQDFVGPCLGGRVFSGRPQGRLLHAQGRRLPQQMDRRIGKTTQTSFRSGLCKLKVIETVGFYRNVTVNSCCYGKYLTIFLTFLSSLQLMRPSIIFFDEIDGLAPVRSSRQDQVNTSSKLFSFSVLK